MDIGVLDIVYTALPLKK